MDEFETTRQFPGKRQLAQMAARVFGHWHHVLNPDVETRTLGHGSPDELAGARGWNVVYRHGNTHVFAVEGESTLWAVGPSREGAVVAVRLEGE